MEGVLYPLIDAFKYLQQWSPIFPALRTGGGRGGGRGDGFMHTCTPLAQIQLCVLTHLPPLVQAGSLEAGLRTRGWGLLPYNMYLEQT